MNNNLKIWLLVLFVLAGCSTEVENINSMAVVERVVDGDTVVLNNSEKVRFVCVNTPEKNEEGYIEATNFLKEILLNKTVLLVKDNTDKDKYKRLLRYVYLSDGTFVNSLIAEKGFGEILMIEPNTKLCPEIKAAEDKAKSEKLGIWAKEKAVEENIDPCVALGCPEGTTAVGSKNSDKWHYCSCKWAKRIKKENLVCFKTTKEAEEKGYKKTQTC